MKKIMVILVIAVIGSGSFYGTSEATKKAKIIIKMATLQPRGSTMMNIMEELRAKVREETNNEVDFKMYAGGVLGDEDEILRKIRLKQLHGGAFTGHALGEIVPAVRVTEIPYLFRNRNEVSYVRGKLEDTMNKYFEDAGYVVLGWGEVGFVHTFSKVPITSLEILKEQKFWAWEGDPLADAIFKVWDISPVFLSFTDVMTSLSTRLIDAATITPFGAVAFRWYTRFKYMNEYPSMNVLGGVIVTREIWDKISHESQNKIKRISKAYHKKLIKANRAENDKSIEVLKKAGISIVRFEDTEISIEYISEIGKKARESLVGKLYSRELLERTLSLLAEYRKNHPNSTIRRIGRIR